MSHPAAHLLHTRSTPRALDHIGIDVHKKERQTRILAQRRDLTGQRIRAERERFAAVLGGESRFNDVDASSTP